MPDSIQKLPDIDFDKVFNLVSSSHVITADVGMDSPSLESFFQLCIELIKLFDFRFNLGLVKYGHNTSIVMMEC